MRPERSPELAQGIVRFYSFISGGNPFLDDVLTGLSRLPKSIAPRHFFDARSPRVLDILSELCECYPARIEMAIMRAHIAEITQFVGPDAQMIELGSGAGARTRALVEALRPPIYVPIDGDAASLKGSAEALSRVFPWLNISGMCADSSVGLVLPEFVGVPIKRKAVYCPSPALGNLTSAQAIEFLRRARRLAGAGGALLIGVNQNKDEPGLDGRYSDPRGAAAQANLNLLMRINSELGGDFQPLRFAHRVFHDPAGGCLEMHLESLYAQFARISGRRFDFAQGETIRTGISCRYAPAEFLELAREAGFAAEQVWSDGQQPFAVYGLIAT